MKIETVRRAPGSVDHPVSAIESRSRPRILVLEGASRIGGGQRVTINTVISLKGRANFEVIVPGSGPLENELNAARIGVSRVGYPAPAGKFGLIDRALYLPRGLVALGPLISLIRNTRPGLLYATSRTALWAVIAGRLTGTPVVVHLHMIPPTDRTAWFLRRVCSMNPVKTVLVASEAIAERVALPREKVRIVPNGIEAPEVPVRPELRSEARSEFRLANSTHLAAVVGELSPEKGQLKAIQALARVSDTCPDAVLMLVGSARLKNQEFQEQLRRLVVMLGLEGRVIFTGERDDVIRLLSGVDLLLVPSFGASGEACPLVVLEAWAAGVPVLCANTGGLPEMVGEGRGALFDIGVDSALATEWRKLLEDRPRMDSLSRAGLEAVRDQYSLQVASERILNAIDEAMSA